MHNDAHCIAEIVSVVCATIMLVTYIYFSHRRR